MFWKTSKVTRSALFILALIGIGAITIVEFTLHKVKQPWFESKLAATKLTQQAHRAIYSAVSDKKIVVDKITDPNETGLIGEQFTLITTDQGDLESKLTSTNPNWAGVIVHLLKRAGVEKGDYVAVAWTGSMPAMNMAVLAAIETIGAIPVIITSIGASMWGANNPDFSWLDMEKLLFDKGIFHYRSVAASIGGRSDRGANISPEGRKLCREIAKRNNIPLIEEETLDESIQTRMEIYQKHIPSGRKYSAYLNVGGGIASVGSAHNVRGIKPGLTKNFPLQNYPIRGAMIRFGLEGIPIIDITLVKKLAQKYGLPMAPHPIPEPPAGEVFFNEQYRTEFVLLIFILYSLLTFIVIRIDVVEYFKRRRKKTDTN
ncbi:poly-gamma-glutamate system protein [bacterium]|nr:MAG: poly-gamma-glutamate system protein [bacterium]